MRDKDIRYAVQQMLSAEHFGDTDTAIVEEMGIWSGSVRIDVAVINGQLSGYELKSDRDTLARLPLQAELYSKVFDRMTLVVGSRHCEHVVNLIPGWWGVLVATAVDGRILLRESRKAQPNPARDAYLVAQLLWKDEAISLLEAHSLARGWRGKKIRAIHERIARELPLTLIADYVRHALKSRREWLRQVTAHQLDMAVHSDSHPVL